MGERPAPGYYSAFLEFENGTPAVVVYNGYGYFDTSELTWGVGERHYNPEERARVRREFRNKTLDEEKAKEAMHFGGKREGEFSHGSAVQSDRARRGIQGGGSFFGITLVTCERGDIRQSRDGIKSIATKGRKSFPSRDGARRAFPS
jgi:phthalate 4,5-cis-dihydrodiol dehydrogenase